MDNYNTCIPERWKALFKKSEPTFTEKLEAAAKSAKQSAIKSFCQASKPKLEGGEQTACNFVCKMGRYAKYLPSLMGKSNAKQAADRCYCNCILTDNPRAAEALATLKDEL